MTVICFLISPAVLRAMGTPADVMDYALTYIQVYFLGLIGSFLYNVGSGILRALGDTRRTLYFLMASCLTNIAIAFMSRPEIMTDVREINVAIDCGGPLTRGMTIWDRRDHFRWEHLPKIRTVFAIDGQKYQQTFYEALGGKQ